jgi:hypothetical protein
MRTGFPFQMFLSDLGDIEQRRWSCSRSGVNSRDGTFFYKSSRGLLGHDEQSFALFDEQNRLSWIHGILFPKRLWDYQPSGGVYCACNFHAPNMVLEMPYVKINAILAVPLSYWMAAT